MHPQEHEFKFDRIEAALNALDKSTRSRIDAVDEKLRALGVTVEAFLAEPVDVWNDTSVHLGFARLKDRYGLVVRRVRAGSEPAVQPLRDADRATRIAVVDHLPKVLEALEEEIEQRRARLSSSEPQRVQVKVESAPAPPPPAAKASEPLPPVEIALPPVSEVDTSLRATPPGNGGTKPRAVPAAGQESVDHMFRLFSRKGR